MQGIHLLKQGMDRTIAQQTIADLPSPLFPFPGAAEARHHIRMGLVNQKSLRFSGPNRLQQSQVGGDPGSAIED